MHTSCNFSQPEVCNIPPLATVKKFVNQKLQTPNLFPRLFLYSIIQK